MSKSMFNRSKFKFLEPGVKYQFDNYIDTELDPNADYVPSYIYEGLDSDECEGAAIRAAREALER